VPEVVVEEPTVPEVVVEEPTVPEVVVEEPTVPEVVVEEPTVPEVVEVKQKLVSKSSKNPKDNAPFFGTDSFGNRYVDNGFTFNGFTTDVNDFKTHMPLQTIQVGESNTAVLKIYNHRGVSTLEHVELVFGLDQIGSDEQKPNSIIWEQDFEGTQKVSTTDSDNLLMDVNAIGKADDRLMEITFSFAFREPLDKSKIGVVVWDKERNSRTAYFNDGIEVIGKSLNPPEIITILDNKGYPIKITKIGKDTGIDEQGNIWTHNSPWTIQSSHIDEKLSNENPDPVSAHGFDRMNNMFDSYKNNQAQEAQKKLNDILGGKNISNFID
ncbi:MAG TPA: hypothetical protein VD731_03145, partial [Nitrosopumilaceae archaeon]|nr:hypothetical protein [Nitrosopumilaceae archaeon]